MQNLLRFIKVLRASAAKRAGLPGIGLGNCAGWMDSLIGGPGLSRGRRHPTEVQIGEVLDFWRVEDLEENKYILLRAEMKVPGKAWLQFEAIPKNGQDATDSNRDVCAERFFRIFILVCNVSGAFFYIRANVRPHCQRRGSLENDVSQLPEQSVNVI